VRGQLPIASHIPHTRWSRELDAPAWHQSAQSILAFGDSHTQVDYEDSYQGGQETMKIMN